METTTLHAQDVTPGDLILWDGNWVPVLDVMPASVNNFVSLVVGPTTWTTKHRRENVSVRKQSSLIKP
jgi:hypothetical protein